MCLLELLITYHKTEKYVLRCLLKERIKYIWLADMKINIVFVQIWNFECNYFVYIWLVCSTTTHVAPVQMINIIVRRNGSVIICYIALSDCFGFGMHVCVLCVL